MVMGHQRSGTNALFFSLAQDRRFDAYGEWSKSEVFYKWKLRPEVETRRVFQKENIILNPVSETIHKSIEDVFNEYKNYNLWIVYIYRDPVNVFASFNVAKRRQKVPMLSPADFMRSWNKRNQCILSALQKHAHKVAIVKYEDMIYDPKVFFETAKFLGVRGKYLFRKDSNKGRAALPEEICSEIDKGTSETFNKLEKNRRVQPCGNNMQLFLRRLLTKIGFLKNKTTFNPFRIIKDGQVAETPQSILKRRP